MGLHGVYDGPDSLFGPHSLGDWRIVQKQKSGQHDPNGWSGCHHDFTHVLINIGMTLGLMPVVGVPLPFFSYGGSSMISMMFGIGLLLNIRMRRFEAG